jgi:NAD(P) transhydrogenase subunit alpha
MGTGVAGLQALSTARRLGARTTGYDVRPDAAEQVRSVGAAWLDPGLEAIGEGGYARELEAQERDAQQAALTTAIAGFDVVITAAQVPGGRAPLLVTAEAVGRMRPGSVVVDLAAESGGNCALSVPGQVRVQHGVTIDAPLDLPSTLPEHASRLYSRNVAAFVDLLLEPGASPAIRRDLAGDEILRAACITALPAKGGAAIPPQEAAV